MIQNFRLILAAAIALIAFGTYTAPCRAEMQIVCDGVLGNSGEQGDDLVAFSRPGARGIGVAYDRYGTLWDRAGEGRLNRYSLDGRLIATYGIPRGSDQGDQLTIVGDIIVLRIRGGLYTLSVEDPSGTEARNMNRNSGAISYGSYNGRFASNANNHIYLIDPASGEVEVAVESCGGANWIELGPDGTIYAVIDWRLNKFVNGEAVTTDGWPKGSPGERPQLIDGFWYGNAWHGTLRRYDSEMQPVPGVVLGGASGSFIGHLEGNYEISNGRGMAKINDNLFAISGLGGQLHLMRWDNDRSQMEIIRRIGAADNCNGLGLDRDGNIWFYTGSWKWDDDPDTPLQLGVNTPEGAGIGQAVMLDNDHMTAPGILWGQPTFYSGRLDRHVRANRREKAPMERGFVGSAVYRHENRQLLLVTNKNGKGHSFYIGHDGNYSGDGTPVTLHPTVETTEWTTLGMKDANTMLAGADGVVVELTRNGTDWRESSRWKSWGNDSFGSKIYITTDSGRLWVSDRERHRVLIFDIATRELLATYGTADNAKNDMEGLSLPQVIAARGNRAVVFDSGNQRLVKLRLE